MIPSPTASPKAQALVRGFNRAVAEKLVIFRVNPTLMGVATVANGWAVKPYELRITGPRPQDVTCNCAAGRKGTECKHRSLSIYCRRHNVYALAPQATKAVRDPLADLFE